MFCCVLSNHPKVWEAWPEFPEKDSRGEKGWQVAECQIRGRELRLPWIRRLLALILRTSMNFTKLQAFVACSFVSMLLKANESMLLKANEKL